MTDDTEEESDIRLSFLLLTVQQIKRAYYGSAWDVVMVDYLRFYVDRLEVWEGDLGDDYLRAFGKKTKRLIERAIREGQHPKTWTETPRLPPAPA